MSPALITPRIAACVGLATSATAPTYLSFDATARAPPMLTNPPTNSPTANGFFENAFQSFDLFFRDLCSAASLRAEGGASAKQRERNRDLLEDVVAGKKLDSQTRSMALASLAYQWPDDKTRKLAQSLLKDSDKSLAEHADRTIKRLEQRKQLENRGLASDRKTVGKDAKAQ